MAELPVGITQKDLDDYAKLDKAIKRASEKKAALNDKIKRAFTVKGTFIFDDVIVKIGEQKRLDGDALEKALPYEKTPQYYRTLFDPTLVDETVKAKFKTVIVSTLSVTVAD